MDFNSLLNFDKFVAPVLIRIVYWIGIVLIVLSTLMAALGGGMMASTYGGGFSVFGSLIALLAGAAALLFWRVMCEVWIVIFSINDRLGVLADREKASS
jgi:hypothetical protein